MPTGTISENAGLAGLTIQSTIQRTGTGGIGHDPSLPAAKAGALSTRTSDTAGTLTLGAGHGITDGQVVNIFWTDVNGESHCAYGATVGTVAGNDVPFTGAAGDVLPAEGCAITVSVVVLIDTDVDGDLLKMIAAGSTLLTHMTFKREAGTVILPVLLLANEGWKWVKGQGIANPLTGDPVGKIAVSNGSVAAIAAFKVAYIYDST